MRTALAVGEPPVAESASNGAACRSARDSVIELTRNSATRLEFARPTRIQTPAIALKVRISTTTGARSLEGLARVRPTRWLGERLGMVGSSGLPCRKGVSQGAVEEVDFTDINQSISAGLSLTGSRWGRPDDTVGLAGAANRISHQGKLYLAAGHSYNLTTDDATVAGGQTLEVNASALGFPDNLTFDGSAETDGRFTITGGTGNDALTGGAGVRRKIGRRPASGASSPPPPLPCKVSGWRRCWSCPRVPDRATWTGSGVPRPG